MRIVQLPNSIRDFVTSHTALVKEWDRTGLKFTLDGRLVGDLAEAVAAEVFGLEFPKKRTPGVDLITPDGQTTVQVKASGINKGPAFTYGKGSADHLIFILIRFEECLAEIVYNGPELPVRKELPEKFAGTKRVKLERVIELDAQQTFRLTRKA